MRRVARYALFVFAVPASLPAQGFAVNELGTCTMGRGGVAAATPCADGSAIWFNPAGLTSITGTVFSASVTAIMPHGGFTDIYFGQKTDMPSQTYWVPSVYLVHRLSPKLGIGIGLYAPYGLGTRWPVDFQGRFDGYKTKLTSFNIQPTFAYQVTKWLSFGLGLAYIHSTVDLHQRLDLSEQLIPANPFLPPGTPFSAIGIPAFTDFADAHLSASGNGIALNGGIQITVSDRMTVGGHFITKRTFKYKGTATFTQVPTGLVIPPGTTPFNPNFPLPVDGLVQGQFLADGALASGSASTEVVLPDQGSIGIAYKAGSRWTLMADYQQIVWGWFNKLNIDFANPRTPDISQYEGFRDSHSFRFGLEFQQSRKTIIRAGYLFHTAAAPDQTVTPLLPEGDRNEFTIGLGSALTRSVRANLAYQYIRQQDRDGRAGTTFNNGLYTFNASLFGAGFSCSF
ncbi:MAG TPA: outer membrane protein transport protein [Gemmatimonadales bacterium]